MAFSIPAGYTKEEYILYMRITAVTSIAISSLLLCSCESSQTNTEEPTEEKPQLVGKLLSESGKEYDIQGTLRVRDGKVKVQEVGENASGYSYEDLVTKKRKGDIIRPADIFIKGFSKTEGKYPYLYWQCDGNWWGYKGGSLMNSLRNKKGGNKVREVWTANGKSAAVQIFQKAPHRWSGINKNGDLSGKDEWGIGSINYSFKGDKFRQQPGERAFWKVMRNSKNIEFVVEKPETSESYYAKWTLPKTLNEMIPDLNKACKKLGVERVSIGAN